MYNRKNIPFQWILSFLVYLGDNIPGGLGVGIETFGHNSEYSATNKWEKKIIRLTAALFSSKSQRRILDNLISQSKVALYLITCSSYEFTKE